MKAQHDPLGRRQSSLGARRLSRIWSHEGAPSTALPAAVVASSEALIRLAKRRESAEIANLVVLRQRAIELKKAEAEKVRVRSDSK